MTKEESVTMWKMEQENMNPDLLTQDMKQLYDKVGELINSGTITYKDFSNDMIDGVTDMIIENTNSSTDLDRTEQVNLLCKNLYEKYTKQYSNIESGEGDTGVPADSTEVLDESEICEPFSTEAAS